MKTLIILLFILCSCSPGRVALLITKAEKSSFLDSTKHTIRKFYHKKTDVILAIIPDRSMYDMDSIVDITEKLPLAKKYSNRVLLTNSLIFTFDGWMIKPAYGYTGNNASAVSTYLFDSTASSWPVINVITHELGHQFGLMHCDDSLCIMYAWGYMDDRNFCRDHGRYLKWLVKHER